MGPPQPTLQPVVDQHPNETNNHKVEPVLETKEDKKLNDLSNQVDELKLSTQVSEEKQESSSNNIASIIIKELSKS